MTALKANIAELNATFGFGGSFQLGNLGLQGSHALLSSLLLLGPQLLRTLLLLLLVGTRKTGPSENIHMQKSCIIDE